MHLGKYSAASTGRRSQQPNKFLVCPDCEKPFAEGVFKEAAVPLGAGDFGRLCARNSMTAKGDAWHERNYHAKRHRCIV